MPERTAQEWFSKFKNGVFGLEDAPRTGRPSDFDVNHLKALLKENSRKTSLEMAEVMECSHMTIVRRLHSMSMTQILGVPHVV